MYIHNKESIKKIVIKYIIGLIPLILYGLYKNGILLYNHDLISIFLLPKIIYLLIISLFIYFLVYVIIFRSKRFWSIDLVALLIIPLFMPPNINLIIYALGLLISYSLATLISKKINFNKIAFCKLFIILLVVIFSTYGYANASEELNIYSLNFWDLLWGRNTGGLASTNIIFALAILVFYSVFNNYKKQIPILSIFTYIVLSLIITNFSVTIFCYSSAIVGMILLNVDSKSTPHNKKAMIIYGIALGILTAITTIWLNINEGVFISSLFLSFFAPMLDKLVEKW